MSKSRVKRLEDRAGVNEKPFEPMRMIVRIVGPKGEDDGAHVVQQGRKTRFFPPGTPDDVLSNCELDPNDETAPI